MRFIYTFGTADGSRHESSTFRGIERQRESFFRKHGRRPAIHRLTLNAQGTCIRDETQATTIGRHMVWVAVVTPLAR